MKRQALLGTPTLFALFTLNFHVLAEQAGLISARKAQACSEEQLKRFAATSPSESAKSIAEGAFDACSELWEAVNDDMFRIIGPPRAGREEQVRADALKQWKEKFLAKAVPMVFQERARAQGR